MAADNIMKGVLAFLLVGSYLLLCLDWRARRAGGLPGTPLGENGGSSQNVAFRHDIVAFGHEVVIPVALGIWQTGAS